VRPPHPTLEHPVDLIDPTPTELPTEPPLAAPTGVGETFRAVARGTVIERRRRSLAGAPRPGRGTPAPEAADSGMWRLAL